MDENKLYELARKRVVAKRSFITHFTTYVAVCAFLAILNYVNSRGDWWVLWVIGGWGIGVAAHGIETYNVLHLGDDAVEREMKKLKDKGI